MSDPKHAWVDEANGLTVDARTRKLLDEVNRVVIDSCLAVYLEILATTLAHESRRGLDTQYIEDEMTWIVNDEYDLGTLRARIEAMAERWAKQAPD